METGDGVAILRAELGTSYLEYTSPAIGRLGRGCRVTLAWTVGEIVYSLNDSKASLLWWTTDSAHMAGEDRSRSQGEARIYPYRRRGAAANTGSL